MCSLILKLFLIKTQTHIRKNFEILVILDDKNTRRNISLII